MSIAALQEAFSHENVQKHFITWNILSRAISIKVLVQTASVNVDCRKAEWLECFISCVIYCHTPARVVKEDEEKRSEPHGTPKHNS